MKVLSIGFIYHDDSYLRDGWNFLDFCIVILSIASLFLNDPNLASIRSLRALRALRPLRLISRAPGMKKVVNALLSSIPRILNVLLVCSLFFLIFGILGTYQLKGKYFIVKWITFLVRLGLHWNKPMALPLGPLRNYSLKKLVSKLAGNGKIHRLILIM